MTSTKMLANATRVASSTLHQRTASMATLTTTTTNSNLVALPPITNYSHGTTSSTSVSASREKPFTEVQVEVQSGYRGENYGVVEVQDDERGQIQLPASYGKSRRLL
uniref:Uncharacterized protein n=1 Tax=Lygus hesperus TaxID=30085 RepID=A0A0A9W6Z0_LYGHE